MRLETKTCSCSLAASISSVPFAMAEERVLIVASVSQALGELRATIGADGTSIELAGPYYNASAPMCCPTKNSASAVLRYRGGKWVETPNYFKIN